MKNNIFISIAIQLLILQIANAKTAVTQINNVAKIDTNIVLPPAWAFGVHYGGYTNQQQTIDRVDNIIKHDYPISSYWIDSWFWDFNNKGKGPGKYIDFVADTIAFPDRHVMWSHLHDNKIMGGFWTWDCILKSGNEAAFNEFLQKGYFRNVYIEKNPWHNNSTSTDMYQKEGGNGGTPCGNINFENKDAVSFFKQKMKHFFVEGADYIKLDRTAAIPVCKAMFEMSQEFGTQTKGRGFILSHSGGLETNEYKKYPCKWTDDTRSDWTVETPEVKFNPWVPPVALKENISRVTNPAQPSGDIPFLTNDLGGFDKGNVKIPDEELYIRWLEFSMLTPVVEVFSQPENPTSNLAYNYSMKADSLFRYYSHLHMELFPYIYSYAHLMRQTGIHIIRKFKNAPYQYLFGNELLASPVYKKGAIFQYIYLPKGNWVDFWTGDVKKGGRRIRVNAPLDKIPLMVRQGAIIPMRPYSRTIEKGYCDTIALNIYPGADSEFDLIEDDGVSDDYLNNHYATTSISMKNKINEVSLMIGNCKGQYKSMPAAKTWKLYIHMTREINNIFCNNKNISFNKKGNVFISDFFMTNIFNVNKIKITYKHQKVNKAK